MTDLSLILEDARPRTPRKAEATKFADPCWTAKGEPRAAVAAAAFTALWFNTGTLCNLACKGCYIESSPRNDRLSYLERSEVRRFLDEARGEHQGIEDVGFTGGEPFMNPDIMGMLEDALAANYRVLVLTNAMVPMRRHRLALCALNARYPGRLTLRVSLDHFTPEGHERIRGRRSWKPAVDGLKWLSDCGFDEHIAYERAIEPVSARHGMQLVRSFRVLNTMGALSGNVVAVSLWDLLRPEALQAIMSDPDYVA